MAYITFALAVCIIGGLFYLIANFSRLNDAGKAALISAMGELGKWAFIVGLAFYLYGK